MNIKAKLILAAAAVSLLSTPAFAFRDMGDAGGDSAYAIPEGHSNSGMGNAGAGYVTPAVPATRLYASAPVTRQRHSMQRQNRLHSHG